MKHFKDENNKIHSFEDNTPLYKLEKYINERGLISITEEEYQAIINIKPAPTIPQIVTMRQARLALLQSGILTDVETAIQNGTDEVLKIEWEYSTTVKRDWQNLIILASSLGLTDEHLDNLFILANTL